MRKYTIYLLSVVFTVCVLPKVSAQKSARIYTDYQKNPVKSILTDFSYAGYHYGEKAIPNLPLKVNVTQRGIIPNTGADLTVPIQKLIDEVGQSGGGVIFFQKGNTV